MLKLVGNKETVERSGKQLFTCTNPELVNAHKTRAEQNRAATVGLSGLPHLSPSKFPGAGERQRDFEPKTKLVSCTGDTTGFPTNKEITTPGSVAFHFNNNVTYQCVTIREKKRERSPGKKKREERHDTF